MPEPTSVIISLKQTIVALAAFFGVNLIGWKMFVSTKIKQIDKHEKDIEEIKKNHISREFLNNLGSQVNLKLDNVNERIDKIYELLIK